MEMESHIVHFNDNVTRQTISAEPVKQKLKEIVPISTITMGVPTEGL